MIRAIRVAGIAYLFGALPHRHGARFLGRGILHADQKDARGRDIRRASGLRQPRTAWFWRALIRRLQPDVVLDIGANYGEMSMLVPRATKLIIIEPQPQLLPWLRLSFGSGQNVTIQPIAASDRDGTAVLHVPSMWSGTASLTGRISHPKFLDESHTDHVVKVARIDSILPDFHGHLAFKIDVEGHEPSVLRGMVRTLEESAAFAGVIEYDADYLRAAGAELNDLRKLVHDAGGTIFNVATNGELVVENAMSNTDLCGDMFVASDPQILQDIRLPFVLRIRRL
jgi:FkbM family methyltransferase